MRRKFTVRNRYILLGDLVFIIISVLGSFVLRFELGSSFYDYLYFAYWMIGVALIVKPVVYYFFGLYRRLWLYASIQEMLLIAAAVTFASALLALVMLLLYTLNVVDGYVRSVFVIDWLLSLFAVGGLRFSLRLIAEKRQNSLNGAAGVTRAKRVLIVGAGEAGAMVVKELLKNPQLNLIPVGFLDDNPTKQKQQIHGVPIVGTISDMTRVLERLHVNEVIIAIPSAPGRVVRTVADISRLNRIVWW